MGHSLLGRLRHSKAWNEVIGLIADGADAPDVAESLIKATEKAFDEVQDDKTFKTVVAYLVDLSQAAASENPKEALAQLGLTFNENTHPLDVTMAARAYLDAKCQEAQADSDFGEIAINSLTSTIVEHMQTNQMQLFDQGESKTYSPMLELKSPAKFGKFGEAFFANLSNNSLKYFLSKDLGTHVGEGKRFATMNQMRQFEDAVTKHCRESAPITRNYCQGWIAKHMRETGGQISAEAAGRFGWYGMNKMRSEISGHHDRYECGA